MNTPNPTVTPVALTPVPTTIPPGYVGTVPPTFVNNPIDFLANRLAADAASMSNYNLNYPIKQNVPGSQLVTITYFYSVAATEGGTTDAAGNPVGTLYERIVQDGASAYTPPAPPTVVMAAVFGLPRRAQVWSDGEVHNSWTMGAGTTYPPGPEGVFFGGIGQPNTTLTNPTLAQPAPDYYEVVEVYMGQAIVQIGQSDALPITG